MNQLIFKRKWQWIDLLRGYTIMIDNDQLFKIYPGREIKVSITSKSKHLYAKIDWCHSNKIDISKCGEDDYVIISNNIGWKAFIPFYVLYVLIFNRGNYLIIELKRRQI